MRQVIPMKRLITMRKTYAELGSLNLNDAGYMTGVIDHLKQCNKTMMYMTGVIYHLKQ